MYLCWYFLAYFFSFWLGKHTVSDIQCGVFAPALCMYDSRKRLLGTFKKLQIIKTKKTPTNQTKNLTPPPRKKKKPKTEKPPNQCNSLRICKARAEHQSEIKIASL